MLENMVAEYHVELAVGKRNPLNVHLDLRQRGLQIGRHVIERRQLLETLQETTLGRDMQQTGRRLEESGLVLQIEPHQPVTLECQTTGTQRVPARIHIAVRHKASIMRTADRTLHAAPRIGETQHRRAQMHHPLDIPSRDMPQYESDQSFHGRRHYSSFKASDTSCSALRSFSRHSLISSAARLTCAPSSSTLICPSLNFSRIRSTSSTACV